ncbi:MAG: arginine N-succinyltransferase [Alphaproteobacteria bacterium]|nr:arginine N-succinyltransferase [Alphaproteobacteria bacterium]
MALPIIRPVRMDDLDQVHALAQATGGGMTNLPPERSALKKRLERAVESFASRATAPGGEVYFCVLEADGKVVGTTAVFSAIGLESGFVNYKVNWTFHASQQLNKRIKRRLLVPTYDFTGAGEVGSLYLSPDARGSGFGKLLARSRYLFIAQKPEIIADPVCAELRGWRAADGAQPFWNALGRHFFDMDFEEADVHNSATGNQFIADLMPRISIYVVLLPDDARACIGKPHDGAAPAYRMLLAEGFEYKDYIDIFDGGPLVSAKKANIRTVRDSRVGKASIVSSIGANVGVGVKLLARGAVSDFRATRAPAAVSDDAIIIDRATADALNAEDGDDVRYVDW